MNRLRRACKGTPALIEFDSLPFKYREALIKKNGGIPHRTLKNKLFADEISLDMDAVSFYQNYRPAGNKIQDKKQRQLANEASILNTIACKYKAHLKRQSSGNKISEFWRNPVTVLPGIKAEWPHKLPLTERNLKLKFIAYQENGYRALVNAHYGNQKTRKVNQHLEALLKHLYTQSWKPNYEEVWDGYNKFITGVKILVNATTGEIYNPKDYEPISVSTVRSYMRAWRNASGTEKTRSRSKIGYNAKNRSYADLRVDHAGAIISMDDRELPFRLKGTHKRVVGYFTADVASGAIIGWAFARPKMRYGDPHGKGLALIFNCFRNTFEQLDYYKVNMPAEVEVENHLMSGLKDTSLKEGNLFQFVRYAEAENPQEKSIEGFFRILRYKYDRKVKGFLARPFAKTEAYQGRPESEEKQAYTFDQIVELAIENIIEYNNDFTPQSEKISG
ncbi:hypothetical protein GNY06_12585 [Elizabethkingia argentiflava]|uniref:Integrase catalytic domain-containing protein n=1 Tax=Elizabethkingia argenteiflava TaxID=2681556 RepID=A0A845PX14_9FLAO|nr:hypothetical protein [Elizabethkingia argenteiflava]NAW52175.1 hypothetical protein [Elizabethkingia argenteiflava]